MVICRNSGEKAANAESGVVVERQTRRSGNIAHDLRHIGLQFRKCCNKMARESSSATAEIARDADVGAHLLSL